jgi:hypothetical protein
MLIEIDAAALQRINEASEWLKRRATHKPKPAALKVHSVPKARALHKHSDQRSLFLDRGGRIDADLAPELRLRKEEAVIGEGLLEGWEE